MKNENGFTLIEMLIVLLVISILLVITIPNLAKHNETIRNKGCEALIVTAQAQVESYYIEYTSYPTIDQLITDGYIKEASCPNGEVLTIDTNTGEVSSQVPAAP